MKKLLPVFILLTFGLGSCKKSTIFIGDNATAKTDITTSKNKITGTISPVGSVDNVELIGNINGEYLRFRALPDNQGKFTFENMEAGDYTIIVNTTSGFIEPAYQKFVMAKATDVNLPNIAIQAARPLGTSSIMGKIVPADAAYSVTFTGAKLAITVVVDPATGGFKAILLPEDTYVARFQAGSRFVSPNVAAVVTQAGKTNDVGTLTFGSNVLISSMTATASQNAVRFETYVNPIANSGSITVIQSGDALSIQGARVAGAIGTPEGGTSTRLGITIDKFTGTGTYVCNSSSASRVTYYYNNTRLSMAPAIDCGSAFEDGNATVIVTAYDPARKIISGTYYGKLKGKYARNGAVYSQDIANGRFHINF